MFRVESRLSLRHARVFPIKRVVSPNPIPAADLLVEDSYIVRFVPRS